MAPVDAAGGQRVPPRDRGVDLAERRGRRPDGRHERIVACVDVRPHAGVQELPVVQVLVAVVKRRIEGCLRSGDRVCPVGGTRLIAWLDDEVDQVQPAILACRLVQAVGEHLVVGEESLRLRVVVGVGSAPADVPPGDLVAALLHAVAVEWPIRSGERPPGCDGPPSVDPGRSGATVVLGTVRRPMGTPLPVGYGRRAGGSTPGACPVDLAARRVRRHHVAGRGLQLLDPLATPDPGVLGRRLERAVRLVVDEGRARRNGLAARPEGAESVVPVGGSFAGDCEALARLTSSERRVLLEMMRGRSGVEIATALTVSLTTVRAHIRAILRKLDVSSQLAAVATAYRVLDRVPPDSA